MTIPQVTSRQGNSTFDCDGAQIRAYSRPLATVVTIRGEIDADNVDRVSEYIRHFILGQNAVVLDMSDVNCVAAEVISLLVMVDEDCGAADVEWIVVASAAFIEFLGVDGITFPIAHSIHEALRNLADGVARRRQLMLALIKKTA